MSRMVITRLVYSDCYFLLEFWSSVVIDGFLVSVCLMDVHEYKNRFAMHSEVMLFRRISILAKL